MPRGRFSGVADWSLAGSVKLALALLFCLSAAYSEFGPSQLHVPAAFRRLHPETIYFCPKRPSKNIWANDYGLENALC